MKVWQMDSLGSHIFSKILDNDYLEDNRGKTIAHSSTEKLFVVCHSKLEKKPLTEQIINVYEL